MLLIWGTRIKKKILAYLKDTCYCEHCNNTSNFKLIVIRKWFTLFWIPIFPIETEYYLCCPICNYGRSLTRKEALRIQEENTISVGVAQPEIE